MAKNKTLENLLKKEMTRKEFLKVAGTTLVGVVGITGVLKNLDKFAAPEKKPTEEKKVTTGYGGGPYGK